MTPHIEAQTGQIADKVIMPGDPLRAKLIADKYLENVEIVSRVRGNNIYTGMYKDKKITVMASGMGIPSMGIYAYELMKEYNVKKIIRVGTCGSYDKNRKLFDIILATSSYSNSKFAYDACGFTEDIMLPSENLNKKIEEKATELKYKLFKGSVISSEVFDAYINDFNSFYTNVKQICNPIASEMESFALFALGQKYNCETACLLTVSDIIGENTKINAEERENKLFEMIFLALETIISD